MSTFDELVEILQKNSKPKKVVPARATVVLVEYSNGASKHVCETEAEVNAVLDAAKANNQSYLVL